MRAYSLPAILFVMACSANAQLPDASPDTAGSDPGPELTMARLPEAPEISSSLDLHTAWSIDAAGEGGQRTAPAMAGRYDKYIAAGQTAPKLSASDKVVLGLRDAVSPFSALGWVSAASYEQIVNGSPNYGQTGKGYAQRLGAAAARDVSEGIFTDSILSPVLHEDPRYYRMGPSHNFVKRLFYAGTRPLITRTDGGRLTPNFALLGGELAGSALTPAYYPPLNRSFTEVTKTFGGSVGSTALGLVMTEFFGGVFGNLHIKSTQ